MSFGIIEILVFAASIAAIALIVWLVVYLAKNSSRVLRAKSTAAHTSPPRDS